VSGAFAPPQDSAANRVSPCFSIVRALAWPPSKPSIMSVVSVSVTFDSDELPRAWR
jgi:hypothetical protein